MQGRNGDADVENRRVGTVKEGKNETNGENGINIHPPSSNVHTPSVEQIAGATLPYDTGSPAWCSVMS